MNDISPTAARQRERARQQDGRFGEQHLHEGDLDVTEKVDPANHPMILEALGEEELDTAQRRAVEALFFECENEDDIENLLDDFEGWDPNDLTHMDMVAGPLAQHSHEHDDKGWMTFTQSTNSDGSPSGYHSVGVFVPRLGAYLTTTEEDLRYTHTSGLQGAVEFAEEIHDKADRLRSSLHRTVPNWDEA